MNLAFGPLIFYLYPLWPHICSPLRLAMYVNLLFDVFQSRILLHNMLMVLQLEMQMRRSALSSLPANADHSTRLQRMDEVLALNEQLDEAAMMLAMLMSLPVREAMNLAQARSNMLGGIISPSSLPTTPSISAPSSVPSLPPTPLSSSGSSQVSGTSSTSQTRASVQQRGRFRFDPVSESEDESDSDSSDSSFLTPTIRRRPSHSDAPAERVLSVNGAGHSPISQSSPRGTSQTTGSLPLPLTSPREGGLATTTELGRARRRSEIRDDLARTMESSNTSTAESVQLPRISAQSNSIQSSSVNRTMGPSSVYRNALSEFRNEGSEQRTSTASSTQTSPRSVSNSNATEALRDSLISQRRLQRGQGVPNRLTMDNRSPNTDAQDVDLHTSPNLNSQLSNSSNPRNESQLNRERSVIRPSARNTSGQASNIMASSTTVPRTSYAPQRRFRREVADGQSPRSTENWSSNDDSSTAVVTQSSQPIIRVSHSDQPNITARYRRQSQQANSSQSTSHHAGTGEHRTTQQEPSSNNTISNSSMAARRASEQPSSSTPNSSLTARRQSKPNTSVEARRISNRSSAGQATISEPSSSSSRDNANASTNKKKPASTPKKKSSPNNVNSSGPTNTRGPSTPGQLMRARRRSEIFQQITMNTTPDDT